MIKSDLPFDISEKPIKDNTEDEQQKSVGKILGRLGNLSGIALPDFSIYIRMFAYYQVAVVLIVLGLIAVLFFSPIGNKVKDKYL